MCSQIVRSTNVIFVGPAERTEGFTYFRAPFFERDAVRWQRCADGLRRDPGNDLTPNRHVVGAPDVGAFVTHL